jgi:hypothetical protein
MRWFRSNCSPAAGSRPAQSTRGARCSAEGSTDAKAVRPGQGAYPEYRSPLAQRGHHVSRAHENGQWQCAGLTHGAPTVGEKSVCCAVAAASRRALMAT